MKCPECGSPVHGAWKDVIIMYLRMWYLWTAGALTGMYLMYFDQPMTINWRGFATTMEQRFPVSTNHYSRPIDQALCTSDMCHRCSVLRRTWRA